MNLEKLPWWAYAAGAGVMLAVLSMLGGGKKAGVTNYPDNGTAGIYAETASQGQETRQLMIQQQLIILSTLDELRRKIDNTYPNEVVHHSLESVV